MARKTHVGPINFRFLLLACGGASLHGVAAAQADQTTCADSAKLQVSPRVGLVSDSLRDHKQITQHSPSLTVYGVSAVGRVPCGPAARIPFIGAGNYALALTGGTTKTSEYRSERLTGEAFLIAPTNRYFAFSVGYKYERAVDELLVAPTSGLSRVETTMHSGRAGFTGTLPLFQTDDSRMFSALFVAAGVQQRRATDVQSGELGDDEFFAGPEVVIGYAIDLSKDLVFDIRYRTALYVTDFSGATDAQTQNGIYASLGYNF